MNDRLRIQKQSAQLKEDFPFLSEYLAGWPASTHGTQVLGLAEMKAKELLGGLIGRPLVYAGAPRVAEQSKNEPTVEEERGPASTVQKAEESKDVGVEKIPGRRRVGLSGMNLE